MKNSPLETSVKAAREGDLATLNTVLRDYPDVVRAIDADGRTLLDLVCRAATADIAIPSEPGTPEQHAAVDRILAAGGNPSASDAAGWTPLHTAAMAGHADLAARLVAAGATLDGRVYGLDGGTPLALALFYAHTHMEGVLAPPVPYNLRTAAALGRDVSSFFEGDALTEQALHGLDFYAPDFFPTWERSKNRQEVIDEALCWATRNNQLGAMSALVERGADVNSNPYRGTPLLWACYRDQVAAATWLLDHDADPDLRHDFGGEGHGVSAVAMHLAAQYNCLDCLELLLSRGADPTITDTAYGGTPTGWARYSGAHEALAILEKHAADH